MKKAEIVVSELVVLSILAVSLILLVIVFITFGSILQEQAPKRECQWNLLLSAITKVPLVSAETLPPDCQMTRINVTKDQLVKKEDLNKKEIETFNNKYPSQKYVNFNPANEKQLLEYEMDSILANEIKDCWEVAWMGQMPIFKEWWDMYKCETNKDTGKYDCECSPGKQCSLSGELYDKLKFWNYDVNGPPVFCLLCSRIKFDDSIVQEFRATPIKSLPEWMQKHPVAGDTQVRSYYEYTQDDVNRGLFAPDYIYSIDEPLAVVYARVNVKQPTQVWDKALEWTGIKDADQVNKPVNSLALMPYSKVGDKCTYIIG